MTEHKADLNIIHSLLELVRTLTPTQSFLQFSPLSLFWSCTLSTFPCHQPLSPMSHRLPPALNCFIL